jgi:hypothetical protein
VTKINLSTQVTEYFVCVGGSGADSAAAIAVDASGSAFLTGYTGSLSPDFPIFPGAGNVQTQNNGGGEDAFVMKLSPDGSQVDFSTFLGGDGIDRGSAIALDSAGTVYVTGDTGSINFPTLNPLPYSFNGNGSAFLVNLTVPQGGTQTPPPILTSLTFACLATPCTPYQIPAGLASTTATITFSGPAQGPFDIGISSDSRNVTFPASIHVDTGASSATFMVYPLNVGALGGLTVTATITASTGLSAVSQPLDIHSGPLVSVPPNLAVPKTLNFTQTSSTSAVGIITLDQPSDGAAVFLSSSDARVIVPASTPSDTSSLTVTFPITNAAPTNGGYSAVITATLHGSSVDGLYTVQQPQIPGLPAGVTLNFGIYATAQRCGAITLSGQAFTDSFNCPDRRQYTARSTFKMRRR